MSFTIAFLIGMTTGVIMTVIALACAQVCRMNDE